MHDHENRIIAHRQLHFPQSTRPPAQFTIFPSVQASRMSTHHNVVLISAAAVLLWSAGTSSSSYSVHAWTSPLPTASKRPSLSRPSSRYAIPGHSQSLYDPYLHSGAGLRTFSSPSDDECEHDDRSSSRFRESRFGFRRRMLTSRLFSSFLDDNDDATEESDMTWSKVSGESRFGVRRRVKKVLQRAKERTGIKNSSEGGVCDSETELNTQQSSFAIVAESASIGGLGGVLVDDKGTVDVALELATKKKTTGTNSTTVVENGATATATTINGASLPRSNDASRMTLPEEEFVMAQSVALNANSDATTDRPAKEVIASDVPAAVEPFYPDPLPFTLPILTSEQKRQLLNDERVQEQSKMGREGSGYVVLDVKAPPYVIWECLLDFESYTETIPTVRDVTLYTSQHLQSGYHKEKPVRAGTNTTLPVRHYGTPSVTRAAFILSKFRLNIAAIHNYRPHPEGDYMVFTLDPECTNLVLQSAKGVWHTESNPDGRGEEYTRVWLLCEVSVSKILPSFIVSYTAKKAMPRATTWLKPQVEAAARLWLKK